jgi:hypothetical protein
MDSFWVVDPLFKKPKKKNEIPLLRCTALGKLDKPTLFS